jgi:hypothetical protein
VAGRFHEGGDHLANVHPERVTTALDVFPRLVYACRSFTGAYSVPPGVPISALMAAA